MVTGGFRSRAGMVAALKSNACYLIGLARPAAAFPHLPKDLVLSENVQDTDAVVHLPKVIPHWLLNWIPIRLINTGVDTLYYVAQINKMGVGQQPAPPAKT